MQFLLNKDRLEPSQPLSSGYEWNGGPTVADERLGVTNIAVGHVQPIGSDPDIGETTLQVGDHL